MVKVKVFYSKKERDDFGFNHPMVKVKGLEQRAEDKFEHVSTTLW